MPAVSALLLFSFVLCSAWRLLRSRVCTAGVAAVCVWSVCLVGYTCRGLGRDVWKCMFWSAAGFSGSGAVQSRMYFLAGAVSGLLQGSQLDRVGFLQAPSLACLRQLPFFDALPRQSCLAHDHARVS